MTACESGTPPGLQIAPDIPKRAAQMPRTVIDHDRSLLSDN